MLRRKPVTDRQSAQSAGATCLGHHPAVTADGAGAIAATVKENQNMCSITSRGDRPLAWYAVHINRLKRDVVSYRPNGSDLIQALAPL